MYICLFLACQVISTIIKLCQVKTLKLDAVTLDLEGIPAMVETIESLPTTISVKDISLPDNYKKMLKEARNLKKV